MTGHHLILGELVDVITGERIEDTHDERLRQRVATCLLQQKGFTRTDIRCRETLLVRCDEKSARVPLDFRIILRNRTAMIIKYAPGSILTRHRPALAMSRLLAPYQVPVVVITNGRSADILSGDTGRQLGEGIETIPDRQRLTRLIGAATWTQLTEKQIEMESRILYAYEVDDSCPCDDTICKL